MRSIKRDNAAFLDTLELIGSAPEVTDSTSADNGLERNPDARLIPIERLASNPNNPRREMTRITELALSIADTGAVLQNLIVRRAPERPGYYIVVAGNRRLAAAQLLNNGALPDVTFRIDALPCVIQDKPQPDNRLDSLTENAAREDLSRVELLDAVIELQDLYGFSAREIARRIGRDNTDISDLMRIARDPELSQLVHAELTNTAVAHAITKLAPAARDRVVEAVRGGQIRTAAEVAAVAASGPVPDSHAISSMAVPATAPDEYTAGAPRVRCDAAAGTEATRLLAPERRAVDQREEARGGLKLVAQFHDTDFQAVLDMIMYAKTYRLQYHTLASELIRARGVSGEHPRQVRAAEVP